MIPKCPGRALSLGIATACFWPPFRASLLDPGTPVADPLSLLAFGGQRFVVVTGRPPPGILDERLDHHHEGGAGGGDLYRMPRMRIGPALDGRFAVTHQPSPEARPAPTG